MKLINLYKKARQHVCCRALSHKIYFLDLEIKTKTDVNSRHVQIFM